MNDEIAVRVRDGRQHFQEEPDPLLDVQLLLIAVLVDALAAHVFQNEIRLAIAFDSGIQQTRDVRVLQAGEHTAFASKPLLRWMADERRIQELYCDLPFVTTVTPM